MIFIGDDWAEDHHDVYLMDETGRRLASAAAARRTDRYPRAARAGRVPCRGTGTGGDRHRNRPRAVGGGADRRRLSGVCDQPVGGGPLPRPSPRLGRQIRCLDAKLLADLVRTDRHNHRSIAGDSPDAEAVKVLARADQNLIWTRTRHTNALRSALREYYPAALVAFEDLAHGDALGVLGGAPSPEQGAHLPLTAIQAALKRGGRQRNIAARAREIRAALGTEQLAAPARSPRRSRPPPAPRSASSAS